MDNEYLSIELSEDGGNYDRLEDLKLNFYSNDMEYQLSIDCNGFYPTLEEYHGREDNDKGYYTVYYWFDEDNILNLNMDLLKWYEAFEGDTVAGISKIIDIVLDRMNECSRLYDFMV